MEVTRVIFKATKQMTGFYDKALTSIAAEINQGDDLELLQCKLIEGEVTAFKYMDAIPLYVSADDANSVVFSEIKKEVI